jgi:predicted Zn finger-like uncharacterized protein
MAQGFSECLEQEIADIRSPLNAMLNAMLIVCPSCGTSYELTPSALGAGRTVRCARCKTVWRAAPVEPVPALAEAGAEPFAAAIGSGHRRPADAPEMPDATAAADVPDLREPEADPVADGNKRSSVAVALEAPPLVPAADDGARSGEMLENAAADEGSQDIESFAARRMRIAREVRARRRGTWFSLPLALLLMAASGAALLVWRERVVELLPQSAGLYAAVGLAVNLRGLAFENVRSAEEMHDNVPLLIVEGTIVNVSARTVEVPRLRFALRNEQGIEIYAWTAQADSQTLSAGETMPFRSQLASPPSDGRDIVVRFFNRRDLAFR